MIKVRKSKASLSNTQQTLDFSGADQSARTSYTIAEITRLLSDTLEEHPILGKAIVLEGELSNVKRSSRGHIYFTLKDTEAAINGILWASTANRLTFDIEPGLAVYLTGRLEIYAPSGTYSIVASKLEPVGVGALQLAFQQIKARLEAEGLFMEEFKKELPEFPERIGIVTSSTGAVIHDMLRVIRRKNPQINVLLAPAKVQGEGASDSIAQAIRELNAAEYQLDAIIVARGGGSFEDLFCFSEEAVVRAIFESRVPIITGIGHEPDYALADAAADYSASTPTAAADWLVPDMQALKEAYDLLAESLMGQMEELILYSEQTLDLHATRLIDTHESVLVTAANRLQQTEERLLSQFELGFQRHGQRLATDVAALDAFNPLHTLTRGFSVTTNAQGKALQSIAAVHTGDTVNVRLSDGTLHCQVQNKKDL